jgi:hypothetical protein
MTRLVIAATVALVRSWLCAWMLLFKCLCVIEPSLAGLTAGTQTGALLAQGTSRACLRPPLVWLHTYRHVRCKGSDSI